MDMMTTIPTSAAATISSLEIAELTGKLHKHVLADIRTMLATLGLRSDEFSANFPDVYGRPRETFNLPFDDTISLAAGCYATLPFKIVKWWRELEQPKTALPDFSSLGPHSIGIEVQLRGL